MSSNHLRYLQELAAEMKLAVIPESQFDILKKETGYEWTNGWTRHRDRIPVKPKPTIGAVAPMKKVRVQIPFQKRKRQRLAHLMGNLNVGRNGRKPRKLKGFIFGDDVWKVRKPRKRRGR